MSFLFFLFETAPFTPAIDIFSFGMCALEMAALEIQGNGDSGAIVTKEQIARTMEGLDDAQQKDFISKCLNENPTERATARELLFHPLLFEVHSLKLLSAHCLINVARMCFYTSALFFTFLFLFFFFIFYFFGLSFVV